MGKTQELVEIDFDKLSKLLYRPAPDLSELENEVQGLERTLSYELSNLNDGEELEAPETIQTTLDFFNLQEDAESLREMILATTGCDSFITTAISPHGIIDNLPHSLRITLLGKKDVEEFREPVEQLSRDFFYDGKTRDEGVHVQVHTLPEYPEVVMWNCTKGLDKAKATRYVSEDSEDKFGNTTQKYRPISLKGPMSELVCAGSELVTKNVIAGNNKEWLERFFELIRKEYPDEAEEVISEGLEYLEKDISKTWERKHLILDQAKLNYMMDRIGRKKELRKRLERQHKQWDAEQVIDSFKDELALEKRDAMENELVEKSIAAKKEGKKFCPQCEETFDANKGLCDYCKKPISEENKNCRDHNEEDYHEACPKCGMDIDWDFFYESSKWDDISDMSRELATKEVIEMGGNKAFLKKYMRPDLAEFIENSYGLPWWKAIDFED